MLTDIQLRNLKSKGGQREVAAGGASGLTVRVNQAGKKTFFLTFRAPSTGKPARMRLGEYNPQRFTLATVRDIAQSYRALLDQDIDPREHLKAEKRTLQQFGVESVGLRAPMLA